jgi:hypothetical protein
MRRLTVVLGLLFSSLLLLPAAASAASMVEYATAATAIEYGLIAANTPADEDWH